LLRLTASLCPATYVCRQRGSARICPPHVAAAAIDGCLLPTGTAEANLSQRVCCRGPMLGQTDGRTDTVLFHRPCSASHAGSISKLVLKAVGCRTGNITRDRRQVSPAVVSGSNADRDVVTIETVHARHADTLPHVTNISAAQGSYFNLFSCVMSLHYCVASGVACCYQCIYIQIYIAPKIVKTNLRCWHSLTRW